MKIITTLLKELERPDDQGRDWYGWATNQMSHTLLGLGVAAVVLPWGTPVLALMAALGVAVFKEIADLIRGGVVKDSVQDLHFQLLGAFLAVFLYLNFPEGIHSLLGSIVLCLLGGVIPRVRKTIESLG